ncbi:avidin-like isoform X1 [Heliangelus exortis]|uniref:avidin-like isoform X1 n=1 Tax=Heliangelus exortis TaxID=472823 RepID=UPI003A9545AE
MSRRLLCVLALPAGAALVGAAAGSQLFCQSAEIPRGDKDGTKEGKATSTQQKSSRREGKCNLSGWWQNDLGSKMNLSTADSHGNFSGVYYTSVSSAQKPIEPSPLSGSQHLDEDGCTFGFIVNWKFSDSIATFAGQCFSGDNGDEVLKTSWLLREKSDSLSSDWKATRIGNNTFTRVG